MVGRLADTVNLGDGGSSDVWDLDCHTVLDGFTDRVSEVVHDDGDDPRRAAEVAAGSDAALVVVGYTYLDEGEYIGETDSSLTDLFPPGDEEEVADRYQATLERLRPTTKPARLEGRAGGFSVGGDRTSLRLSDDDVRLIRAVAAANARTVVAIQAGSAVLSSEWIGSVPAVVQSWYGGCRAGPGLADVVLGDVNPSARLAFSVPVDEADLPAFDRHATEFRYDRWHGWWHLARNRRRPAFPFGFGLSYTTFVLDEFDVSPEGDTVVVLGAVRNTGDRDGADVVQVYARLPADDRPDRLVGFTRVPVAAGAGARFEVRVPIDRLATRDPERHAWAPASGPHRIVVARHAGDPSAIEATIHLGA